MVLNASIDPLPVAELLPLPAIVIAAASDLTSASFCSCVIILPSKAARTVSKTSLADHHVFVKAKAMSS